MTAADVPLRIPGTGPGAGAGAAGAEPFDLCGPLPSGTTVLEASAGTGKTFTIAALATRYVAEGWADLSSLLLATFSRAATQELRERVRERLVRTERALADPVRTRTEGDALERLLADADDGEVRTRRARLGRALAEFDAATIATTHGFCQQMLAGLGMVGDADRGATFVEDVDDLVTEVVADLYVRKYAPEADVPQLDHAGALQVARAAMGDRQADLVEPGPEARDEERHRYGLARKVREEVETRKRARRLLDYDDLLTRLRDALVDERRGETACARVRARYSVVLVDEFQDTDPVQWEILRRAFHGHTTLVLIGDPKQAIYAFRGADLTTYLAAVDSATEHRTLGRNWRSDAPLLDALHHLFGGVALGDARIAVRDVAAHHAERRLTGAGAPLRLRVLDRGAGPTAGGGDLRVGGARDVVARDVARDVVGLLESGATLALAGESRLVGPGDVAVLVRTNAQAFAVRDRLVASGVPAVLTGTRSVFSSRMARDWLTLLRALEQPHRAGLVRAAALTCFVGWTPERLATEGDEGLHTLGPLLREWRDVLTTRGVAAVLEVMTAGDLAVRLLATPEGERDLTDLRHVGEALHGAAADGHLGPAALVEWLQRRVAEADEDAAEERSRRLESDADAVQVVTVHGSKGLQFPVVYVPYGWDRYAVKDPDPLRFHDDGGTRLLDVGGPRGSRYATHKRLHLAEEYGEDLRLLYVAMTRAQCQVVAHWAPTTNTRTAPLNRVLLSGAAPGEVPPTAAPVPEDEPVRRTLTARAAEAGDAWAVERVPVGAPDVRWAPSSAAPGPLVAGTFGRALDTSWRRTSYTGLTAPLHDDHAPGHAGVGVSSEPETPERADEPPLAAAEDAEPPAGQAADAQEAALRAVPSPMADLPAGTAFGTLTHTVLETADTTAPDLAEELRTRCADAVRGRLGTTVDPDALAAALLPAMRTPLGPSASGLRLCDVPPSDLLAELDFELPLAGGDTPRDADATVDALSGLLRTHLPADDPLAGYADALDVPALRGQRLRGYLTGSIDAVIRVRGDDGEPRYLVADYKTNWLGDVGPLGPEPLTAWHYRPEALRDAMVQAHYPLQALLYAAALHRFLRWRQHGYDPEVHLGGVLYLFVRGMCGPETPVVDGVPCGVFAWRPPAALVTDLSALLDGTRPDGGAV